LASGDLVTGQELWALMQRVETMRYRAEQIEARSAEWPEPERSRALDLAAHWRQLAEEVSALSTKVRSPRPRRSGGRAA
jgi:hypothetical protein